MSIYSQSSRHSSPARDTRTRDEIMRDAMKTPPGGQFGAGQFGGNSNDSEQPAALAVAGDDDELPATLFSPSSRPVRNSNEQAVARRLALHSKLNPYQVRAAEEFTQLTSIGRDVQIFIGLCSLDNKLDTVIAAIPPFEVTESLLENIKRYSIAVLYSPTLSAYRGPIPCELVLNFLDKKLRVLPSNIHKDAAALKKVRAAITEALTQTRSHMKKVLRASYDKDNLADSSSMFDLAKALVANTRCSITGPVCARFALLREIATIKRVDSKAERAYWPDVDKELTDIRRNAGNDLVKIDRYLRSVYLDADRAKYGAGESYVIKESVEGDGVQDSMDAHVAEDA